MHMGLVAMIEDVVRRAGAARQNRQQNRGQSAFSDAGTHDSAASQAKRHSDPVFAGFADVEDEIAIGHMLSLIEDDALTESELAHLRKEWQLAGGRSSASPAPAAPASPR
jgi:methylmalonyl-CoA mutase